MRRPRVLVVAVAVGLPARQLLEVRMVARLFGRNTARGVVDEHHLKQLEADRLEITA